MTAFRRCVLAALVLLSVCQVGVEAAPRDSRDVVTQRRVETWPDRATPRPATAAGPVAADEPPGDEAAAYPLGAPAKPGTIVSVAGGSCEGYAATQATINPLRIAVAPNGDVYWVERDLVVSKHGSLLVRTLDADGRVRTLTSVLRPLTGRHNRQGEWSEWVTSLAATNRGVYYTVWSHISGRGYTDTPISGSINFVDRSGKITHIAGDGYFEGKDAGAWREPRNADGRAPLNTFLGMPQAIAIDADENIYWTEGLGMSMRAGVRFLNRGDRPKVFYPGTPDETVVQPGTIMTIVNFSNIDDRNLLAEFPVMNEQPEPARRLSFQYLPSIALHGDLLYVLNVALHNQADNGPPGTPVGRSSVHAVNLGFGRRAVRAHGVTIQPAYGDYVAGTPGSDSPGYSGDLRPARGAQLNLRYSAYNGSIAIGKDGALLIADTRNHRLRSVDAQLGLITTLAGTGQPGYDEGARPFLSRLWNPLGLGVRADGAILFADHQNMRIRAYTSASQPLRTIAGRGRRPCGTGRLATGRTALGGAYFGAIRDVGLASNGDLFVADGSFNQIVRVTPDGRVDPATIGAGIECGAGRYADIDDACPDYGEPAGDDGPFSAALLAEPRHIVVDSYDNLYISDLDRVRYVNRTNRPISVLGVTVRPRTIASVIVFPKRRVELVNAAGLKVGEQLMPIGDIALDDHGALFVADPMLNVVYRRGPCGDLTVVAGNGIASEAGGEGDGGLAVAASITPAGHIEYDRAREVLLVFDYPQESTPRVRGVSFARKDVVEFGTDIAPDRIETIAGGNGCEAEMSCSYGDGGLAVLAGLAGSGLAVSEDRLYIADSPYHRIRVVDQRGRIGVVASPVPENTDGRLEVAPSPFDPITPSGYGFSGDGGQALRAGIDLAVNSTSVKSPNPFSPKPPPFAFQTGMTVVAGDLVFADSGRVRLIRGADDARVNYRPTMPLPRLVAVRVPSFDVPNELRDERGTEAQQDAGVTYPSLRIAGGTLTVAAGRGAGRGCDLWQAPTNAWRDAAWTPVGPDVRGVGIGGRRCGLAVDGERVDVSTDVDAATAEDGSAVRTATLLATRSNGVWTQAATPGSTEAKAIAGSTVATVGGKTVVAYSDGTRVQVADVGAAFTPLGSVDVEPVSIGELVADGNRLSLPLVAWPRSAQDPAVLVATSLDGGVTWRTEHVADAGIDVGLVLASRPGLAAGRDGTRHVTWSDKRDVWISTSSGGRWSTPRTINPRASYGMLPGITVAPDGRPVVAYYAANARGHASREQRRGPIDDYTSVWNVVVTVVDGARVESFVAVRQAAHLGELCLGARCANDNLNERVQQVGPSESTRVALGGNWRDFGPVAVAVGPSGEVTLAYTRSKVAGAGGSSGTVVAVTKECAASLLTGRTLPPCRDELPPRPEPIVQPPDDAVPDLPRLQCSPLPPKFPKARPRPIPPAPAEEVAGPAAPRLTVAVVPLIPVVPGIPAFPAAHAPANAPASSQVLEQMSATQNALNGQAGMATNEDEQVEEATQYAFSRRPEASPVALLGAAALLSAAAALAHRTRHRPARN